MNVNVQMTDCRNRRLFLKMCSNMSLSNRLLFPVISEQRIVIYAFILKTTLMNEDVQECVTTHNLCDSCWFLSAFHSSICFSPSLHVKYVV